MFNRQLLETILKEVRNLRTKIDKLSEVQETENADANPQQGIRRAEKGNRKAVYFEVGVWFDERDNSLHVSSRAIGTGFNVSITNNPQTRRGHPTLYKWLSACLRATGAPAPRQEKRNPKGV